jgi:hypothetical protein
MFNVGLLDPQFSPANQVHWFSGSWMIDPEQSAECVETVRAARRGCVSLFTLAPTRSCEQGWAMRLGGRDLLLPYDPNVAPSSEAWSALNDAERIDVVVEYHR